MQVGWCARMRATKGRRKRRTQEPQERTNERASTKSERNSTRKRTGNRTKFEPKSSENRPGGLRDAPGRSGGRPGRSRDASESSPGPLRDVPGSSRGTPGRSRSSPGSPQNVPGRSRDASDSVRSAFFATVAPASVFASLFGRISAISASRAGRPTCVLYWFLQYKTHVGPFPLHDRARRGNSRKALEKRPGNHSEIAPATPSSAPAAPPRDRASAV